MSLLTNSSIALLPDGGKAGKLYSLIPTDGSGDFTVVRALDTATRVNENGLIETVLANVPRIDFSGGGCGELLVEPERTNLVEYSQDPSQSVWNKQNGATVDSNVATSPDGTTNADRINLDANALSRVENPTTISNATEYTFSVYLKSESGSVDVLILGGGVLPTSKTVTVTEEWQRFEVTDTSTGTSSFPQIRNSSASAKSVLAWGFQLEEGSYATSYIPTSGSTVTRNVDLITGVNFGSLLNKNQGSFFAEVKPFDASQMRFALTSSPSAANNTIRITLSSNDIFTTNTENSLLATVSDSYVGNEYVKFIGTYSPTSVSTTVDGNARAVTLGDGSLPNDLETINFSAFVSTILFYGRIKALLIYQAALDGDASEVLSGYSSFAEIANNKNYTVL